MLRRGVCQCPSRYHTGRLHCGDRPPWSRCRPPKSIMCRTWRCGLCTSVHTSTRSQSRSEGISGKRVSYDPGKFLQKSWFSDIACLTLCALSSSNSHRPLSQPNGVPLSPVARQHSASVLLPTHLVFLWGDGPLVDWSLV